VNLVTFILLKNGTMIEISVIKTQFACNVQQIPCTGEVVKGDAGTWIVDEANRLGADVIVVGSRGNGVIKRLVPIKHVIGVLVI